ncbi:M20/M25/M40 family metallo-hydrolase [Kribbella sandramycini]|uniref:Glutamate carboxypeptidase n=1 Tax=Kribbella sandramycini TaxID=60450 RepID=A0A7Y4L5K5_9ACTN|nr:M20/M25/M40 family metallo-hydrolase [Kribbella sandramycini]MBB6570731.1 glutamate carboxypeptidase [Kribbella sandramycini]NOL43872.1 M20/M25/M40 family metallo-hydrolase [Kribbella sandramycini]
MDQMIEDIRTLVTCESPSDDLAAVAASADVVAQLGAERLGSTPEYVVIDGRTHLRWQFGDGPNRALVVGHHDTVWPLGSLATHPFVVKDGILRGPGCFDMKTGLVMAFHAIAALPDRSGVTLLITGDEELGSPSSRALIEAEAAGCVAALVLEASAEGALKLERKGVSNYEVRITGRASHAGLEPELGVNASIEAAHQVLAISALGDPETGTTVTPTKLVSGTTRNTVPAAASFLVDGRARTVAEQLRVDEAMQSLAPVLPEAEIEVIGGPNRPPFERKMAEDLFQQASRIALQLGQPALRAISVGGASDGNFTAGIGTPTLDGLGAVGGGAHAADEHVVVAEIAPRTALLTALMTELLDQS